MIALAAIGVIASSGGNPGPGGPVNTVAPAVSAPGLFPRAGDTLSCTTGTWTGDPESFAYQWYSSYEGEAFAEIPDATGDTYEIPGDANLNWVFKCAVVASSAQGSSAPVDSNETLPTNTDAVVSGAGNPGFDGTYTPRGLHNDRPYYTKDGEPDSFENSALRSSGTAWEITGNTGLVTYSSNSTAYYPFAAPDFSAGAPEDEPAPVITPA